MFQVNFSGCSGVFGVPNDVVDEHIKLCGALSMKALMVLLRHGRPMEVTELALLLSQSEGDIKDALSYWVQVGMITSDSQPAPVAQPSVQPIAVVAAAEEPAPDAEEKKVVLKERFYRMTRHDVNKVAGEDGNVGVLLEESQNVLGRPLSNGESETLVSLYHHYGMELDILLMLLHYCKSVEKDSPGYYEKMAIDWVNREITSHDRAEAELLRLTEKTKIETEIRSIFGIYNRAISKKEVEYYTSWAVEMKFDEKMIKLAYEKTIDAKGSVSFPYINAILKAWCSKGIKTPDDAQRETKMGIGANPKKGSNGGPDGNSSYDLNKLEEMISHGNIWD